MNLETKDGRLLVAGVEIHQSSDTFRGNEVDAPAAKLWTALPAVYDQLGLPINGVDAEKRAVAAVNFRTRVQLNKVRLSQYVDCGGGGSIGGRAADSYTITFNNAGQSPGFRLPGGVTIHDTGLIVGVATFDSATDEFISFEVVKLAGPRPDACPAIIAALT